MESVLGLLRRSGVRDREPDSDDSLRNFNTRRLFHVIEKIQSEQDIIDDIDACLKNGADVNAPNDTGHTALHIAEQKNYPSLVEFLLGRGAVRAACSACSVPSRPDAPDTSNNNSIDWEIEDRFTELIIDNNLKIGRDNYIDSLKTVPKDRYSIKEKLNLEPYPSDRTLALLALEVYSDIPAELPGGWELLTTARNPVRTNGYFGAAFWCPDLQQVVVAHRGTTLANLGALWTDFKSIFCNKETSHVCSAVTFTEAIAAALNNVKREGVSFQLSITGHSLGGWLAQVTAFTVKYLQKRDEFTFRRVKNLRDGFHAHTVAFDSPGCKRMLSKMKAQFDLKCERLMILKKLDITSYLSAPNLINTLNPHLGTVYRIITDLSEVTRLRHTSIAHSMENMLKAIEEPSIFRMLDWPTSKEEYSEFLESATPDNKFHLETYGYVFKDIDRNCCSSRMFSEDELLLLDAWMVLTKCKMNLTNLIKIDSLTISDLFDEFVIDNEKQTVTCSSEESVQKVIRHTKALVRWLPARVMAATREQAALVPSAAEAMFRAEADSYLRSLERSRLDFRDAPGLEAFLSSGSDILIIRSADSAAEMARLVNILRQINIKSGRLDNRTDNYSFMDLNGIRRLEAAVNIRGLLQSCFIEDYLFIIQCTENCDRNSKTILNEILKNLKNNKLVLVESHDTGVEKLVKLFHVSQQIDNNYVLKHSEEINLNDLTEASMEILFKQKIIRLQGELLSLEDLVGDYRRLTAGQLNGVNALIEPRMLKNLLTVDNYVIEMEDGLLSHDDLKVHSTVNKEVSVPKFARALREHSGEALLLISGIGPEQLGTDPWRDLARALGEERISTTEADGESIFKKICRAEPGATVYWLACTASAGLVHCKSIYETGFYMKRRFHKIIFNLKTFVPQAHRQRDIFVFQNVGDKRSLMSHVTISKKNRFLKTVHVKMAASTEEAENVIKENPGMAVHILEQEANGGLIEWRRSRGSLDGLLPYVTVYNGKTVDEGELRNTSQKVVIIADEPGMGKSTSLTSVSRLLRPSAWVIRVDLKDFQIPNFQNFPTELSLKSACELILRDADSRLRGLLQVCLDKNNENSRGVYVFFDGFDEIKRDSSTERSAEHLVIKLLQYLNNETAARVWVTTRVYRREILEKALSAIAMRFERISECHQREYLVEFWRPHLLLELDRYGDAEKEKVEKCAEYVFQNAKRVLGDDVQNFMGIPLQMRMLAEVSVQRVKAYVQSEPDIENIFDVESVFDLYQQFVGLKYDIYFGDKTGLSAGLSEKMKHSTVEQLTERHRLLGLRTLFPEFAKRHFDAPEAGWGDDLCRVGLVQAGGGGGEDVQFIHRTLAELFCADLAVHWLRMRGRYHGHAPVAELLLSDILLRDSRNVIRMFVNHLVLSRPLSEDADEFFALKMSELWCSSVKQHYLFDHLRGTALHAAVWEGSTGIVAILAGGSDRASSRRELVRFVAAHDGDRRTALGLAVQLAGGDRPSQIMKKYIQSVETRPHEVILELLLATYIRYADVFDDEIKCLSEYVGGEAAGPALNAAFTRTREVLRTSVPRLLAAVRGDRAKEVERVYGGMENDTERRYLLLAPGAGGWGGSVLHRAARSGGTEELNEILTQIVIMLFSQNVPEAGRSYDARGETPLHRAAAAGQLEIVKHFINRGVYIDSLTGVERETALFTAARAGRLPVVAYLVEKGADITAVNKYGCTALDAATRSGHRPVMEYLQRASPHLPSGGGEAQLYGS